MILMGNRVLIQLDKELEHSTTESGLVVPNFIREETDGGKIKARASRLSFLSKGTVLSISPLAKEILEKESSELKEGDKVFISPNAVSPQYEFSLNRDNSTTFFEGIISVPVSLIEAKINE